jgi:hypothetical protein
MRLKIDSSILDLRNGLSSAVRKKIEEVPANGICGVVFCGTSETEDYHSLLGKLKKAKQQSILNFELKVRSFSTTPEDLLYADLPLDRFIQFAGQRAHQIAALYEYYEV